MEAYLEAPDCLLVIHFHLPPSPPPSSILLHQDLQFSLSSRFLGP